MLKGRYATDDLSALLQLSLKVYSDTELFAAANIINIL